MHRVSINDIRYLCFSFYLAKSECMRKLSYCDVPDAVCETKSKNGKKSYHCYCKRGFTGKNSNCIGKEFFSSAEIRLVVSKSR